MIKIKKHQSRMPHGKSHPSDPDFRFVFSFDFSLSLHFVLNYVSSWCFLMNEIKRYSRS